MKIQYLLPGQDPNRKQNNLRMGAFLEQWQRSWNAGPDKMYEELHPLGKIRLAVGMKVKDDKAIKKDIMFMQEEFGQIQSYKIIAYKQRTNEYAVEVRYSKKGILTAAMNIQQDQRGQWRLFGLDLDDGKTALNALKSYQQQ